MSEAESITPNDIRRAAAELRKHQDPGILLDEEAAAELNASYEAMGLATRVSAGERVIVMWPRT